MNSPQQLLDGKEKFFEECAEGKWNALKIRSTCERIAHSYAALLLAEKKKKAKELAIFCNVTVSSGKRVKLIALDDVLSLLSEEV